MRRAKSNAREYDIRIRIATDDGRTHDQAYFL
jgi:hypothetical protein